MTSNLSLFDGVVIFSQVVQNGSFTAAAEVTGHSTSYISKEINKLESRLGVRLLNRTTRSLGLTPEGEAYFQQCQQMIQDAEHIIGIVNQQDLMPKGTLKISCPVAFSLGYLSDVISEYAKRYPEVTLDIDLNDRRVDIIQEGYDLAIRATGQLETSSLIGRKFHTSKAYTVASKRYIKEYGLPQTPEQLTEHKCICYANLKQPTKWQFQRPDGSNVSVDVSANVICNNSTMELALVLDGHGVCRLPEFTMAEALKSGELVTLFPDYPEQTIDVFVVYPSRKHLSPKIRCFIDMLVESFNR